MNYLNNIPTAFFTGTPQIRPRSKYLNLSSSKEHAAVDAASRPPWIMGDQCKKSILLDKEYYWI
jgi:hypothetical protein